MEPIEERLNYLHDLVIDWVKFADTKASVLLAVQGGMASIILPNIIGHAKVFAQSWIILGCLVLGLASALTSVFWAIRAILPRLSVGAPTSHIYFAHIADMNGSPREIANVLRSKTSEDHAFFMDISKQIFFNSKVCNQKFKNVRLSTFGLVGAILFSTIGAITSFIIQMH